ncbi:MAG: hypothetical protein AAF360_08930, partial [Pseudomonadota bacterium]
CTPKQAVECGLSALRRLLEPTFDGISRWGAFFGRSEICSGSDSYPPNGRTSPGACVTQITATPAAPAARMLLSVFL